jgi:hypothetical protein
MDRFTGLIGVAVIFMKRFDLKYDDLVKADWEIVYDDK